MAFRRHSMRSLLNSYGSRRHPETTCSPIFDGTISKTWRASGVLALPRKAIKMDLSYTIGTRRSVTGGTLTAGRPIMAERGLGLRTTMPSTARRSFSNVRGNVTTGNSWRNAVMGKMTHVPSWIGSTVKSKGLASASIIIIASGACSNRWQSSNGGGASCIGLWGSGGDTKGDDDTPKWLRKKEGKKDDETLLDMLKNGFINISDHIQEQDGIAIGPVQELSGGFFMGVCCGFALKKTGKFVAFALGFFFCGIQVLSYYGIAKVDYSRMEKYFTEIRDSVKDVKDLEPLLNRGVEMGEKALPACSGFIAGAVLGFKKG